MDDVTTVYLRRRNAQFMALGTVIVGIICVGLAEHLQNHHALFVSLFSVGFLLAALGVGVGVLTSRCPVCDRPVNFLIMRMEQHDRCGRCRQKLKTQPQHAGGG